MRFQPWGELIPTNGHRSTPAVASPLRDTGQPTNRGRLLRNRRHLLLATYPWGRHGRQESSSRTIASAPRAEAGTASGWKRTPGRRQDLPEWWRLADRGGVHRTGERRNANRPRFGQALAAARLHNTSLVVSKVDHLTRSVSFQSRLLDSGVDLRFADLPQLEGPTGRFLLHQIAAVAELEAGMISARIKVELAQAKRRGGRTGQAN